MVLVSSTTFCASDSGPPRSHCSRDTGRIRCLGCPSHYSEPEQRGDREQCECCKAASLTRTLAGPAVWRWCFSFMIAPFDILPIHLMAAGMGSGQMPYCLDIPSVRLAPRLSGLPVRGSGRSASVATFAAICLVGAATTLHLIETDNSQSSARQLLTHFRDGRPADLGCCLSVRGEGGLEGVREVCSGA